LAHDLPRSGLQLLNHQWLIFKENFFSAHIP